jgi:hypothetical protein
MEPARAGARGSAQKYGAQRALVECDMSSQTATGPAPRERGLGYALTGALGITLAAVLIGGVLLAWLLLAARGPAAAELLPADVQLYAATTPNVAGVVEVAQLRDALRQGFGVANPAALLEPLEDRLGVDLRDDVTVWLGSEVIVAARGADAEALRGADPAAALLRDGEVLLIFGSKNDPQAEVFLQKHADARTAGGLTVSRRDVGDAPIYVVEGGDGVLTAFGLVQHYVVFSNSAAALEAMARDAQAEGASLAELPAFGAYREQVSERGSVAVYTDGTPDAELVRAAVRDVIAGLGE